MNQVSDEPIARYDEVADWYAAWIGDSPGVIWAEGLLPEQLVGKRVLDVACGPGRLSRELARRGADVLGVDLSERQLDIARQAPAPGAGRVEYLAADLARPERWWDGRPFDGATAEMALQDIEHLALTIAAVAACLLPGGWFLASLVHPCFPGSQKGLPSWPPELGYGAEGWWHSPEHNPDGIRLRVGSFHRRLSTYLNCLTDAGLAIDKVVEPAGELPMLLVLAARKREEWS